MCMPGDHVSITVELIDPIAIEKGLKFAIREGEERSVPAPSRKSSNKIAHLLLRFKYKKNELKATSQANRNRAMHFSKALF